MSIALIIATTAIVNKTQAQVRVSLNIGIPVYAAVHHSPVVVYDEPYPDPYRVERARPMVIVRDEYRYRDYDDCDRRREMHEMHERREHERYRDEDRYENRYERRDDNRYRRY